MFEKTCLLIVVLYLVPACTYLKVNGDGNQIEINQPRQTDTGFYIPANNDN